MIATPPSTTIKPMASARTGVRFVGGAAAGLPPRAPGDGRDLVGGIGDSFETGPTPGLTGAGEHERHDQSKGRQGHRRYRQVAEATYPDDRAGVGDIAGAGL